MADLNPFDDLVDLVTGGGGTGRIAPETRPGGKKKGKKGRPKEDFTFVDRVPVAPKTRPAAHEHTPAGGGGTSGATGGGTPAVTGGAPFSPDSDVIAYVEENYPQFSWLLRNPEMVDLFRRAMGESWSGEKFNLELQKTAWWQTTSESVRKWEALKSTDSSSAEELLRQQSALVSDQVARLGVDMAPEVFGRIVESAVRFNWTPEELDDAIVKHVSFGSVSGGLAAGAMQQVAKMQSDFGVPLSRSAQEDWARRLLVGEVNPESLRAYFVEQAKSLYPTLAGALDSGLTVRQYADPYVQIAAEDLEVPEGQINLSDPKWSRPLIQTDAEGNRVAMSLHDWRQLIRSDDLYNWKGTKAAQDKAETFALGLARTFGAVA